MSDCQSGAALAADRSQSWWLLSRLFLERPEPALLGDLASSLATVPNDSGMDQEIQALRAYLEAGDMEALSQQLAPEYTRLLRGIQEGIGPPPPYESLFRGGGLMSDATQSVRAHYLAAGFGEIAPEAGPQDHLGAELRFLSMLSFREAEAWEREAEAKALAMQEAQRAFLEQHLMTWLPDYSLRLADESKEPFYRAVAQLTLVFAERIQSDLEYNHDAFQVA